MSVRLINRNKADKSITNKAELFGAFMEASTEAFLMFDSKLFTTEMNKAALKLVRADRSKIIGIDIKNLLPNMNQGNRFDALRDVVRTGDAYRYRDYFLDPEKGNRLFEIAAFKLGHGLGMIMYDVGAHTTKIAPLTSVSETSEAVQAVIHDPFLILDSSNRVLGANRSFYDHFLVKTTTVIGESIYDVGETQWNIAGLHELLDHKLFRTGTVRDFEIQGYFTGLGERILVLNATQFYNEMENQLVTLLAINDVTDVAAQRETLKKLSDIYVNSPEPILITDLQGKIIDLNEEAVALYGWSRNELIQKSFKTIIPPDAREQYDTLLQTVVASQVVRDLETEHWSKKGEILPINLNVFLLQNRAGENIGTVAYIKHIASQSQAEKALKNLNKIVLDSNDPVIITDLNNTITEINSVAEATYGWPRGTIVGKPATTMVVPQEQKKYENLLADCILRKTVHNQNVSCITKQGVTLKTQISLHILTDAKNQPSGIAHISKLVSDREKAIQSSKQLIKNFMEIDDPVIVEDMSGEVIDLNNAAASIFGWKKSDFIGKLAHTVIPADQQKQASDLIQRCKAGEVIKNVESKRWTKSGSFFPVELTMFQITDPGGIPNKIVTISKNPDSAGRVKASSSEIDTELLYSESADPIVIEDLSGNVVEMNKAAEKLFGWRRIDLKGKQIKTIIPADQHKHHEKILLLCQNGVPIKKMESKRWSKTGQVYPVAVSLILLKNVEGDPTGIANVTPDLTDQLTLQSQVQRLKQQLGHR